MEFIPLAQVVHHIDSGKPFDCEVVKADVKRGTGGEIRVYQRAVKYVKQQISKRETAKAETASVLSRNANHYENSTRNIYLTAERNTAKIHLRLIVRFNGLPVS